MVSNFRTFKKDHGHLTSPIWLKSGTKANFRVLTTKWVLKSFSCFCLTEVVKADQVRLYLPANMAYRRCPLTSTPVLKSLEINKKIYPFPAHLLEKCGKWQILITGYPNVKRSFCAPWTVKNLPQLVSMISLMLPRSRSCHLLHGTMFCHGWIESINKKMGKFKGQRRNQLLISLPVRSKVQVVISPRMKANF